MIQNLEADDFQVRETANARLLDWAKNQGDEGLSELLKLSRKHPSAEVRVRAFDVLRQCLDARYEQNGQGYMGIMMKDLRAVVPGEAGGQLPVIMVTMVVHDSKAEEAGLKVGDLIYELNGKNWKALPPTHLASDDIKKKIQSMKPGTQVKLSVFRDKKTIEFTLTLGRKPEALEIMPMGIPPEDFMGKVREMEQQAREKHFKKWLLDQKNGR